MLNKDSSSHFSLTSAELQTLTLRILDLAQKHGATAAESEISQASGFSVTARHGDVETISHHRDKDLSLTVYLDQKSGNVSTADFSESALEAAVIKALTIARHTAKDHCAGLAEPDWLAREWTTPDLYFPWTISIEEAIALACDSEAAALAVDHRIKRSEGATVARGESEFFYANTLGFGGGYRGSRHHVECAVIGEENGAMQRDGWYTIARDPKVLLSGKEVGRMAGARTVRRLNARSLPTMRCPVIFEAPEAADLIGAFVRAISGGNLYRKMTFLPDAMGKAVFAPHVSIEEKPLLAGALASAPFDDEGVATQTRFIIQNGVVHNYFLSCYSARKLGMVSTGNSGGAHNLLVTHGDEGLPKLLQRMGRGLLVTEQLGQGINPITGDFSRGAAGYWIENGEIAYPVEGITIAGNLRDIFQNIIAIGNDVDQRFVCQTGSIWVESMMVAGR